MQHLMSLKVSGRGGACSQALLNGLRQMVPLNKSHKAVVSALLLVHAVLLAWASTCHSPTWVEVAQLPAGMSHWIFGKFDLFRVNPPLVRTIAAAPVLLARPTTNWASYSS